MVPEAVKEPPEVMVTMPPRPEDEVEEMPWVMVVLPPEVRVVVAALPEEVLAVMLLMVRVENSEVAEMEPEPVEELTDKRPVETAWLASRAMEPPAAEVEEARVEPAREMVPERFERLAVSVIVPPLPVPPVADRLPAADVIEPAKRVIEPPVAEAETFRDEASGMEREVVLSERRIEIVPPLTPVDLMEAAVPLAGFGGEPP